MRAPLPHWHWEQALVHCSTRTPAAHCRYWGAVYPSTVHLRYPKAGFTNPSVSLHVYDASSGTTASMALSVEPFAASYYIYEVDWLDATHLLVRQMNRGQNVQEFALCDVASGVCELKFTESVANGWICNKCLMYPLPARNSFLHSSINGDTNQIAEWPLDGDSPTFLTANEAGETWEVTDVVGVDAAQTFVAFERTENSSTDRHVHLLQLPQLSIDAKPGSNASAAKLKSTKRPEPRRAACEAGAEVASVWSASISPSGTWLMCRYHGNGARLPIDRCHRGKMPPAATEAPAQRPRVLLRFGCVSPLGRGRGGVSLFRAAGLAAQGGAALHPEPLCHR